MTVQSSSDTGMVAEWVRRLKQNDSEAALQLWQRYSKRMLSLGRKRLRTSRPAAFDEEDIALSAFNTFCSAVKEGKHIQSQEHDDLWPLLATITNRKANDRLKSERAAKRSSPLELVDPKSRQLKDDSRLSRIPDPEMGPDVRVLVAEQCRRLLESLQDPELEQIVVMKLDGYTNDEVAAQLGRTRRTIQRMLSLIREKWQVELDQGYLADG